MTGCKATVEHTLPKPKGPRPPDPPPLNLYTYGCGREHPHASGIVARCMGVPYCPVCVKERELGRLLTKEEHIAAMATLKDAVTPALPPFDADRPCPKCGATGAGTSYRSGGKELLLTPGGRTVEIPESPVHPERLRRTCTRCGYGWDEAPLDNEEQSR